ncbi:MAG TPA: hypothetical protein VMB03_10200 [Bryobacteraceae bacterium]|nr:hypothetical protein [Bryobacteraceae bacterium]
MLVYPQLASGALAQFPLQRRRQARTIVNTAADGTVIKLADAGAGTVEWQLKYAGLSDAELAALLAFFTAAEGSLNSFTFVDPAANLLAWSDDLSNAVWNAAPLLVLAGGSQDPTGGTNAWQVTNPGAAPQALTQTLTAPGGYLYCLSVYARADSAGTLTLLIGNNRYDQTLGTDWQRIACTGTGDPTASSMTFGVDVGTGANVAIYGMQVEPQDCPSIYKPSTTGGCYENARFRDDTLTFTSTDVNRHSATVNIFYANNL